jgi:hypothetical protein
LDNLIENLRIKLVPGKNRFQVIEYSTRIKYKGYLQKIVRKTKKTRRRNALIIYKKTLNITLLYILRRISKNEKNKKN